MLKKILALLFLLCISVPCAAQQVGPQPYFPQTIGTWVPTDASGAALALTATSVSYTRIGNMVFVSGVVTYPVTADTSAAKIGGLPVGVPNQTYGDMPFAIVVPSVATAIYGIPIQNTSQFNIVSAGNVAVQNVTLSGKSVFFLAIYPAS